MLTRPQMLQNASPIILHSINRVRYKPYHNLPSKPRSTNAPRKFSPRVNKSFTCYQEIPSSTPKNRSLSVEKYKILSGEVSPKARTKSTILRTRNLRSSSKLVNGHPGPGDFEETKEQKFKKEILGSWLDRGLSEMRLGEFSSAIVFFSKVLKEQPNHIDALFNRACSLMNISENKQAIPDLMSVLHENPLYDKKVYIALAMCFANLNDYDTAIRQLGKGLLKFPKFVEGYVTRGQLFAQQMRWDKAVQDFYKAISLNQNEGLAFLSLGDAYLAMNDKKNAIKAYSQAIQCGATSSQALIKRAKLFFEQQEFSKSISDLELALSYNSEDPEAYYYKALILLSQENLTEAALCLEQVIKFDIQDRKYTGAAIYDLGAIKIKQKDYYGAMHTFKRATDINLEVKEQKILKGYVEAILCMMKRKFKEGISQLTRIIKKKDPLIQEYIGNCYAFRGYGYASLEKHDQAVKNLIAASKIQELDNASKFNLQISTAVIKSEKEPNESLQIIEESLKEFPKNVEPLAYQAAVYFAQSRKTNNKKLGEKAKTILDKAISLRDSDSDLYFFRGLVLYYLNRPIEAVPDYEIAIDKAEDNMPVHFMCRGLCYAQLKLIKEAMQDFSIAIQLNENLSEPYYYRGRCAYIMDDTQQAFQDFQKMITNKHEDPAVHVHAGNLLMLVGSIEDAGKAFTNANSIKPTVSAFVQRAKCYMLMEKIDLALGDLESAAGVEKSKDVDFDIEMIKIISETEGVNDNTEGHKDLNVKQGLNTTKTSEAKSKDSNYYSENILNKKLDQLSKALSLQAKGNIFKEKHVHWYKGVFLFMLGEIQKAKVEFKSALDTKYESEDLNTDKDNSEVLYNLALCYILSEQYDAAIIHLQELVYILENTDRGKVLLLIGILNLALQQNDQARAVMLEAFKFDPTTSTSYLEEKPQVEVLPFSSNSNLAKKYPLKVAKIRECHPIYLRPSFNYPNATLPSMDFNIEDNVLDNFLVKSVKCKPEAPWLNRVKGTIQFTEEIRELQSESVASTVKSDSDEENDSIFDNSFSEMKVFRSAVVFTMKDKAKQDTAELFNYVKKKDQPGNLVIVDASEDVKRKIDSICSSNFEDYD